MLLCHLVFGLALILRAASRHLKLPLLSSDNYGWTVAVTLGSNKQRLSLLFDTGSADLVVFSSLVVSSSGPPFPPLYNPLASTTFLNTTTALSVSYQSGLMTGWWATDNLYLPEPLPYLSMGVIDNTSLGYDGMDGIMGVSFAAASFHRFANDTVPLNVPELVVVAGYAGSNLFSVWGNRQGGNGEVLFGAVDHGKYTGALTILALVNVYEQYGAPHPVSFVVSVQAFVPEGTSFTGTSALLDTGTLVLVLPQTVADAIRAGVGAVHSAADGNHYVPKSANLTGKALSVTFEGVVITLPYSEMLLPTDDHTQWILAVETGPQTILGAPFFRAAYVVFDLENYVARIAPGRYDGVVDVEDLTFPSGLCG